MITPTPSTRSKNRLRILAGLIGISTLGVIAVLYFRTRLNSAPECPDPKYRIQAFEISEGMKVDVFADDAFVKHPVSLCLDDRNRVYASESLRHERDAFGTHDHQFMLLDDLASRTVEDRLQVLEKWAHHFDGGMRFFSRHSDRLRLISDRNGDGRADCVDVIADGLNQPLDGIASGIAVRDQDVYLGCVPNIWKIHDANGDGLAKRKEILHTGFGVHIAFADHALHAFSWGPDGKLYFAMGDRGFNVRTAEGKLLDGSGTGAILRCNADGSELEVVARGLRNTKAMAFDEYGNLFFCDNGPHPSKPALFHYVVPGGDYGWRTSYQHMPNEAYLGAWRLDMIGEVGAADRAAWVVPPVGCASVGPSGLVRYPGVGLSERYQQHFFLSDYRFSVTQSGIYSLRLAPDGAGFKMTPAERFLWNVPVTDVRFGYDGKMYLSFWVWDRNLIKTQDACSGIYTMYDPERVQSREVREVMALFASGFRNLGVPRLVELLEHPDMRVRQRAHFELSERGATGQDALSTVALENPNRLARIHAIWGLGIVARSAPATLARLESLLADQDDEVRAQTAKVLGEHRYRPAAPRLMELLTDTSHRVSYFAALGLGRIGYRPALNAVLTMLEQNQNQDPFLRQAGVIALHGIGDPDTLLERLEGADDCRRMEILLALRRFADSRIECFLQDPNPAIVTEAARAVYDLPIESAMPALAAMIEQIQSAPERVVSLALITRVINANLRVGETANALALAVYAANEQHDERTRLEAIQSLQNWEQPPARDLVTGTLRPLAKRQASSLATELQPHVASLLGSKNDDVQRETVRLIAANPALSKMFNLRALISDASRSVSIRAEALRLSTDRQDPGLKELIDVALADKSPIMRVEAAASLATIDQARGTSLLVRSLDGESILERQLAIRRLGKLSDPRVDQAIADEVDKVLNHSSPREISADVIEAASTRSANNLIKAKLEKYETSLKADDPLSPYRIALYGGDPAVGEQLVKFHVNVQCLQCHQVHGNGGRIGPDISNVAKGKSREQILESLIVPSAKIALGFELTTLVLNDGRTLGGVVMKQNDAELQLRLPTGQMISVALDDIETRTPPTSAMPPLGKVLKVTELRDIVEFLMTRCNAPESSPKPVHGADRGNPKFERSEPSANDREAAAAK